MSFDAKLWCGITAVITALTTHVAIALTTEQFAWIISMQLAAIGYFPALGLMGSMLIDSHYKNKKDESC